MEIYNRNRIVLRGREYMKKILTFTIVMISLLLMGCSSQNGPKSVDNQFLKATEARWEYLDKYTDESESIYLKEAVKKELDILEKYGELNEEEEVFNDPKLKKIAEDYIDALNIPHNPYLYIDTSELHHLLPFLPSLEFFHLS